MLVGRRIVFYAAMEVLFALRLVGISFEGNILQEGLIIDGVRGYRRSWVHRIHAYSLGGF